MNHLVKITYNDGTCGYLNVFHAVQVHVTMGIIEATRMDQETAERWVHWLNRSSQYVASVIEWEH